MCQPYQLSGYIYDDRMIMNSEFERISAETVVCWKIISAFTYGVLMKPSRNPQDSWSFVRNSSGIFSE
jgi:hypothetical protein